VGVVGRPAEHGLMSSGGVHDLTRAGIWWRRADFGLIGFGSYFDFKRSECEDEELQFVFAFLKPCDLRA
jgi:hypothetical protein